MMLPTENLMASVSLFQLWCDLKRRFRGPVPQLFALVTLRLALEPQHQTQSQVSLIEAFGCKTGELLCYLLRLTRACGTEGGALTLGWRLRHKPGREPKCSGNWLTSNL